MTSLGSRLLLYKQGGEGPCDPWTFLARGSQPRQASLVGLRKVLFPVTWPTVGLSSSVPTCQHSTRIGVLSRWLVAANPSVWGEASHLAGWALPRGHAATPQLVAQRQPLPGLPIQALALCVPEPHVRGPLSFGPPLAGAVSLFRRRTFPRRTQVCWIGLQTRAQRSQNALALSPLLWEAAGGGPTREKPVPQRMIGSLPSSLQGAALGWVGAAPHALGPGSHLVSQPHLPWARAPSLTWFFSLKVLKS